MAVKIYTDPEKNPGQKVFLKHDDETGEPVYGIVRAPGAKQLRKLSRPFERSSRRKGRQALMKVPKKNQEAYGAAILDWAWLDTIGCNVKMADEETAAFFRSELPDAPFDIGPGTVICLDGMLTKNLKKAIADSDVEINRKLNEAMGIGAGDEEDEDDEAEREGYLDENLVSGSNSESVIRPSPKSGVDGASSSEVEPRRVYPRTN